MKPIYQTLLSFAIVAWLLTGIVAFKVTLDKSQISNIEVETAKKDGALAQKRLEMKYADLVQQQQEAKEKAALEQRRQSDLEAQETAKREEVEAQEKAKQDKIDHDEYIATLLQNLERGRKICLKSHEETWWFSDCQDVNGNEIPCESITYVCDEWGTRKQ